MIQWLCVQIAFGDVWGFAFVWTMFFVLTNGSLAVVVITFSRYLVAGVSEEAQTNRLIGSPIVFLCSK